jgi:hypothetical protein
MKILIAFLLGMAFTKVLQWVRKPINDEDFRSRHGW